MRGDGHHCSMYDVINKLLRTVICYLNTNSQRPANTYTTMQTRLLDVEKFLITVKHGNSLILVSRNVYYRFVRWLFILYSDYLIEITNVGLLFNKTVD